jgi:hypothetical protein
VAPDDPQHFLVSFLRRELLRHNRRALGFFVFTLVAALMFWVVLYGVTYWLLLLLLSAVKGGDAAVPEGFPLAFLAIACALLVGAWLDRLATTNDLPRDETSASEILADFVLAIPRTTFAVFDNLSAWRRLTDDEIEQAADLLGAVLKERRVPMHAAPLCIPDDRARERVIYTLLLLEILHLHWEGNVAWLRLSPLAPARLQLSAGNAVV